MSFIPIRRAVLIDSLDQDQLVKGYMAGFKGDPCPRDASYSFEHGWRNGACDKGYRKSDSAQTELVRDYLHSRGGL